MKRNVVESVSVPSVGFGVCCVHKKRIIHQKLKRLAFCIFLFSCMWGGQTTGIREKRKCVEERERGVFMNVTLK